MKSGLRDRNNVRHLFEVEFTVGLVSMKSGLRDRNNVGRGGGGSWSFLVSMKSGLRDRNNSDLSSCCPVASRSRLNEVRS